MTVRPSTAAEASLADQAGLVPGPALEDLAGLLRIAQARRSLNLPRRPQSISVDCRDRTAAQNPTKLTPAEPAASPMDFAPINGASVVG